MFPDIVARERLPIWPMVLLLAANALPAAAEVISVNFYHTDGTVEEQIETGIVPVSGWNNVQSPGGFGLHSSATSFGPIVVHDLDGAQAATISSSLGSYYNGDSGGPSTGLASDWMEEYISWDVETDGIPPNDSGTITVADLDTTFTRPGYDVIVYFDTDSNDRVHTISIGGQVVTGLDGSTFNGVLVEATGASSDANYAVFRGLTAPSFTITMDSSSGRGALNALQVVSASYTSPPPAGPNIVLFVVDDMGWQDLSVPLAEEPTVWNDLYDTPHLDTLAASGMKFTDAYAASPVCSPSRTSILTGRNPARTGITNWVSTIGRSDGNSVVTDPEWTSEGLQPADGNTTLPSVLRDLGYLTAHVGKAHFGAQNSPGADPISLGFDINVGGSDRGNPSSYFPDYGGALVAPGLEAYWSTGTYLTEALTLEATKIIDQALASGKSFFVNLSHYAVHTPLEGQGDPAFLPAYTSRPTPEDDYAAMVASMDASAGAIIQHLRTRGVADRTLVLFLSDNGGLSRFLRYDSPDPNDPWQINEHNAPLASGKGSALEGGLRVPMIVAWAGQDPAEPPVQPLLPIEPGSTAREPVHTDDLFATLLSVAGVVDPQPYTAGTDGTNLAPLLSRQPFTRERPLFFHYPHQWVGDVGIGPGIEPFTAARSGRWKLIYYWSGRNWALYDLADDLGETSNLSTLQTGVLDSLGRGMIDWLVGIGAQLPRNAANLLEEPLPILPPPGCADGIDNDGDGFADSGADPGCVGGEDTSEWDPDLPCDNGLDDDGDGQVDLADADCTDPLDPSEGAVTAVAPGSRPDASLRTGLNPTRPNPSNPRAEVRFALARSAMTTIDVYDVQGRHVRRLLRERLPAGTHTRIWEGDDDRGAEVASGAYFLRMTADGRTFWDRLTVLR